MADIPPGGNPFPQNTPGGVTLRIWRGKPFPEMGFVGGLQKPSDHPVSAGGHRIDSSKLRGPEPSAV
jgi:hypothetical protein